MVNYYSQNGEDFLLNEIFKDKEAGFFVEVGCIDGRRFSNTLAFEEKGWSGLCVEAHADYVELLRKNRPGSIVCHYPLDKHQLVEREVEIDTRSANARQLFSLREISSWLGKIKSVIKGVRRNISRPFKSNPYPDLLNKKSKNSLHEPNQARFNFFKVGFHGDLYLLQLVNTIAQNTILFIETGTNVGSTLGYMARSYPHLQCLSCEPDVQAFQCAVRNTAGLRNATIYNETSQDFLKRLGERSSHVFNEDVLFWLDAHGYDFKWPLKEEIAFITENFKAAYILIDDFRVPGLDCFGYDAYQDQECSFEYIKDALNPKVKYAVYYPSYTERTSQHHPLRGWGLIEFGHKGALILPDSLQGKVRCVEYSCQE